MAGTDKSKLGRRIAKQSVSSGGTFLGPSSFEGQIMPPPSKFPKLGGRTEFDGAAIFSNMPLHSVEDVLPDDLNLAPKKVQAPKVHPTILIYGRHADLHYVIPGYPDPPRDATYQELMLLIPFVQFKGSDKLYTYVIRMYLDDFWAIKFGNIWYGYAKKRGKLARRDVDLTPSTFNASVRGKTIFEVSLASTGQWRSSANAYSTLPNYRDMQILMSMPLIGSKKVSGKHAFYVRSYFRWDDSETFIRPLKSTHQFKRPFVKNMDSWITCGSIDSVEDGAIAIRNLDWRLRWPPHEIRPGQRQVMDAEWRKLVRSRATRKSKR